KSSPNNRPQKLPPNAPALVMLCSCSVLGFLRPSGQVTIAASTISISSAFCCLSSSWSAWRAPVASLNFHTVSVAMVRAPPLPQRSGNTLRGRGRAEHHPPGASASSSRGSRDRLHRLIDDQDEPSQQLI